MVIFHRYVSLPAGKTTIFLWFSYRFPMVTITHWQVKAVERRRAQRAASLGRATKEAEKLVEKRWEAGKGWGPLSNGGARPFGAHAENPLFLQYVQYMYIQYLDTYIYIHVCKTMQCNPMQCNVTGWWFGTFFIFHNIWDNLSH